MNTKTLLLGTSALVAATFAGGAAMAGQVGSKDAMSLTLGGELLFNVGMVDQDVSAGRGRGYSFTVDSAEVHVEASNTADNGLLYGVAIELNADATSATAADEAYAYVDSATWGRIEMGDNDDATDRMYVESDDILVGRKGPDGDPTDFFAVGGAIAATGNSATGDNTKLIYFSPRFGGFQLGASLTPDTGINSGTGGLVDTDNDGDFVNVVGLGANWTGTYDDVGITLSLTGEFGDAETASGAATVGDVETISVGGTVTFAGFGIGAGYVDFGDRSITAAAQATGADAGSYWTLGGSYTAGPWGFSANWFESTRDNGGALADTDVQLITFDLAYQVAPGWELNAALALLDAENINGNAANVNNDGTMFVIGNQFNF